MERETYLFLSTLAYRYLFYTLWKFYLLLSIQKQYINIKIKEKNLPIPPKSWRVFIDFIYRDIYLYPMVVNYPSYEYFKSVAYNQATL